MLLSKRPQCSSHRRRCSPLPGTQSSQLGPFPLRSADPADAPPCCSGQLFLRSLGAPRWGREGDRDAVRGLLLWPAVFPSAFLRPRDGRRGSDRRPCWPPARASEVLRMAGQRDGSGLCPALAAGAEAGSTRGKKGAHLPDFSVCLGHFYRNYCQHQRS